MEELTIKELRLDYMQVSNEAARFVDPFAPTVRRVPLGDEDLFRDRINELIEEGYEFTGQNSSNDYHIITLEKRTAIPTKKGQ